MKDNDLLNLLEMNAKLNSCDLATLLDEDETIINAKIGELEKEQIICGYHTIINWDKTNKDSVSSIIYVDAQPERDYGYDRIAKSIYSFPEVESMYLTSGKSDFIIMMHAATMNDIANFVATKLACINGVTSTSTLIVLKTYKASNTVMAADEAQKERLVVTP